MTDLESISREEEEGARLLRAIGEDWQAFCAHAQSRFDKGDLGALVRMMYVCTHLQRPLPAWAGEAFLTGFQKVKSGEFRSWDDVFGAPHKGRKIDSVKLHNQAFSVHARCRHLHEQESLPIDDALWTKVGKEMGLKKTTVSELYYEYEHHAAPLRQAGILPSAKA
jgi:hypothetical protein